MSRIQRQALSQGAAVQGFKILNVRDFSATLHIALGSNSTGLSLCVFLVCHVMLCHRPKCAFGVPILTCLLMSQTQRCLWSADTVREKLPVETWTVQVPLSGKLQIRYSLTLLR